MPMDDSSNPQKLHFETLHQLYERHYYDPTSMAYRHRWIYEPLFKGLDLSGASVADLACGSGHNSIALREYFPGVQTTGYDISEAACRDYTTRTNRPAFPIDLTRDVKIEREYDAAIVIGGLHHCVLDLNATLRNITRMVRPGGYLLMMEPNDAFILNLVRMFWYRHDGMFEATSEAPLGHDDLLARVSGHFVSDRVAYFGGPAFYLIYNSMILRVPLGLKPFLNPVLLPLESAYNALPGKWPFSSFTAVWRRTVAPIGTIPG